MAVYGSEVFRSVLTVQEGFGFVPLGFRRVSALTTRTIQARSFGLRRFGAHIRTDQARLVVRGLIFRRLGRRFSQTLALARQATPNIT